VCGRRQLPEVEQVEQIGRSSTAPEQFVVARAACDLRGQLMRAQAPDRPIQRDPGAGEAVLTQVFPERERILRLWHRVQVPAVQLANCCRNLPRSTRRCPGSPIQYAYPSSTLTLPFSRLTKIFVCEYGSSA